MSQQPNVEVRVLESRAVDELVARIQTAAAAPGATEAVDRWRAVHGDGSTDPGHDHVVVDDALMYLHDAPDGLAIPHAQYPDGTRRVFTDLAHAPTLDTP